MRKSPATRYPEDQALITWEHDGLTFSLIKHTRLDHYCGYVRFPPKPLQANGYAGIATYVPVHGGITYAETDADGSMVYGFDCAHAGDDERPETRDLAWLQAECEHLALGISVAAAHEPAYLAAADDEARAAVLDDYHRVMREVYGQRFEIRDNFGALLNVLSGKL